MMDDQDLKDRPKPITPDKDHWITRVVSDWLITLPEWGVLIYVLAGIGLPVMFWWWVF